MAVNYNPKIVTDGLVLYLDAGNTKSYPGTGTVWTDLSGRGNNGTLVNGPTFSTNNGGYITTDGTNDYIEVADNSSLDFGTSSFTVEYWFRKLQTTVGYDNIWGPNKWNRGDLTGTNEWAMIIGNGDVPGTDNRYSFFVESGTTSYGVTHITNPLQLSTWYQLIGVRNGGTLSLYLNSTLTQSASPPGFTASSSINNVSGRVLRIATSANSGQQTNSDSAMLRIYNRALTATEIAQNFNATRGRFGI